MTLHEAMLSRCSRRKYIPSPIDAEKAAKLRGSLDEYNQLGSLDMRLVLNNGDAWNGIRKSYGMFSGVQNYVGLIYNTGGPDALERLGYYGELWVLQAAALGLGTCWVGGSFKRELCPFELKKDEVVACAIAVGNVEDELSGKEKFIHRLTHRKTKTIQDMTASDGGTVPEWFQKGMEMVQRAPSAVNRQPVTFTIKYGEVSASVPDISNTGMALDFGIAKLHFELGAGNGKWDWGNGGVFKLN